MRHINEIIIHCTATRPDWSANESNAWKVAQVRKWHVQDRGWSDIGYHYLIHRDGSIAKGRPLEKVGAHVKGQNKNSIGISLFGGFGGSADDAFEDNFTEKQNVSLRNLIRELTSDFPTIEKISGHSEYANKACPCFNVQEWFAKKPTLSHPDPVEQPLQKSASALLVEFISDLIRLASMGSKK